MRKSLYISMPVNGRPEGTFAEKYKAAKRRATKLTRLYAGRARVVTTFKLNPIGCFTEEEAMGRCIQAVLECDTILMDIGYKDSKGCLAELAVAQIYGKRVIYVNDEK